MNNNVLLKCLSITKTLFKFTVWIHLYVENAKHDPLKESQQDNNVPIQLLKK
jgi:hypothetical protein